MQQLRLDLDASTVKSLSDFDFGVWATPEGIAYVNGKQPLFPRDDSFTHGL